MKRLFFLMSLTVLAFILTDCTCKCNKQYSHKMDARLLEAIDAARDGGINPAFAVEIKLNTPFSDDIKKQLNDSEVRIESNTDKTVIAKAQHKAIRKISKFGFVEYITLLTANYYPNK